MPVVNSCIGAEGRAFQICVALFYFTDQRRQYHVYSLSTCQRCYHCAKCGFRRRRKEQTQYTSTILCFLFRGYISSGDRPHFFVSLGQSQRCLLREVGNDRCCFQVLEITKLTTPDFIKITNVPRHIPSCRKRTFVLSFSNESMSLSKLAA